uniref:C2 NT-type domain-containing protein n=1 Tax=Cajanus cajan TaxID=3821 RepID=A0A151T8M5_CAJCA|nr:hypothetical protein KK1_017940 [Cajanus cajan]
MKGKNRRSGGAIQMEYLIHIQEIKPWPPSQSLRTLRSVLIQWENGERYSGSTGLVSPSLGPNSSAGEGKLEFNESFRLPVTLSRDVSIRNSTADVFQKNCLEFHLYETRRDKTVKGQLLGTAIIDLADCGILRETLSIRTPLNCQRNYRNTDPPLLFIQIEPVEKSRARSSLKDSLLKEVPKETNDRESVSALMNGEYAEEAEIASFTDDDVSSHSSAAAVTTSSESSACMPPEHEEVFSHIHYLICRRLHFCFFNHVRMCDKLYCPLALFAIDYFITNVSRLCTCGREVTAPGAVTIPLITPFHCGSYNTVSKGISSVISIKSHHLIIATGLQNGPSQNSGRNDKEHHLASETRVEKLNIMQQDAYERLERSSSYVSSMDVSSEVGSPVNGHTSMTSTPNHKSMTNPKQVASSNANSSPSGSDNGMKGNILKNERLKHVKSVRSSADSARIIGSLGSNHLGEVKENGVHGDAQNSGGNIRSIDRKDAKIYPREARNAILDSKVEHLENKIKMLEGELREAAAIEAALYSVVAEHGSSMSKVHAPARRLSRLYLHACKENLQARRAGAAKSVVSGLTLVAKACGNDVPRLTFWLSNSIVLRTIISKTTKEMTASNPAGTSISNWDDPNVFTSALEKVETWIFSRIVESIWWQSLTPHMQLSDAKVTRKDSVKNYKNMPSSFDQEQGNLSLDIWKNAFREACERLCPIRAGGHECGCLSLLPRLIMEQCVARLDVAMFNAVLRESADDIPTDPVSDPISDPKVLPIPPGKSSFGAGAQLKTAIGNWSRWLTDLFGMDDDDSLEDRDDDDLHSNDGSQNTSFKSFHLLNALSDLLMLPKDMLLNASIRKEVCPMFSASLIKKILDNFVPDEFCPDPIPNDVFEALDSQDDLEDGNECINNFPCNAAPIVYSPPPAATITNITGEIGSGSQLRRSRSSVVRKSYTKSRDESAIRYELLRDVWMNSE